MTLKQVKNEENTHIVNKKTSISNANYLSYQQRRNAVGLKEEFRL